MVTNTWPYRVDGELGRFEFPTYRVCDEQTTLYDTSRELFAPLGCGERYQTSGFKEIAFMRGVTEQSYHKTTTLLNRIRHQEGATSVTTLRASAEREGKKVFSRVSNAPPPRFCASMDLTRPVSPSRRVLCGRATPWAYHQSRSRRPSTPAS